MRCAYSFVLALLAALVFSVPSFGGGASRDASKVVAEIDSIIAATHYRQDLMGVARTRTVRSYATTPSDAYRQWVRRYWKGVAKKVNEQYNAPPHYSSWLCIHSHEAGSWATNTGNGYYGGVQMDFGFMDTYGGELLRAKGTANNWSMLEQMWVSERAYRGYGGYGPRYFGPWPNTARMCGLF
jgi:hypothetical protein